MNYSLAQRYELGEIIGSGGMSDVYAAQDTLLGRDVAVKMLRSEMARDMNFRERFRREARLGNPAVPLSELRAALSPDSPYHDARSLHR